MIQYSMQYNDKVSSDFGVILYDSAKFSGGEKHYESSSIAGKNGEIVSKDTYQSNLTIQCFLTVLNGNIMQKIRQLKRWLSGTGKLKFSDTPDVFYKVLKISYDEIERELKQYGNFTVSFLCVPYEFREDGQNEYSQITQNPYALARPIYKITGEGMCMLTVNGNEMTANVGQNLTIDTDLMIAYRQDGTMQNTAVTGDYEDMYLLPGDNVISITSGFDLKIIPNWGYEI